MKNKKLFSRILPPVALAGILAGCAGEQKQVSFGEDIQPLLKKYCLECHVEGGRGYRRTGLLLTSYDTLMEGHIVEPGNPSKSEMVLYVQPSPDPSSQMPYGDRPKLAKSEIELFESWVAQGAKNN